MAPAAENVVYAASRQRGPTTSPSPQGSSTSVRQPVLGYLEASKYPPGFVDSDGPILIPALEAKGITVRRLAWNTPMTDAQLLECDGYFYGSPWDNWAENMPVFLAFSERLEGLGIEQINCQAALRSGSHKSYLPGMAQLGVATVPTKVLWAPSNGGAPLTTDVAALYSIGGIDYDEIVLKPGSSGGALGTGRFRRDEYQRALQHTEHLHRQGQDVIAQPFLEQILTKRELGTVIINGADGDVTHAFTKASILEAGASPDVVHAFHPDRRPHQLSATDIARTQATLKAWKELHGLTDRDQFVARFDTIAGDLLEGELVAPMKGLSIEGIDPRGLSALTDMISSAMFAARDTRLATPTLLVPKMGGHELDDSGLAGMAL